MWQEALRVCREYAPHKLDELQEEYDKNVMKQTGTSSASGDVRLLLEQAAKWEQTDDVAKAIDCYMKVGGRPETVCRSAGSSVGTGRSAGR